MSRLATACSLFALIGLGVVAPGTATTNSPDDPGGVNIPLDQKQRGVSWVAAGEITPLHMRPLKDANVEWIMQTPFGWQERYDSPRIGLSTSGGFWGETDAGLGLTTKYAKRHGIKTLLKPHIWLREKPDGKWRANIDFPDEAGWTEWFDQYRAFILHYAKFAQKQEIEALCIGTELHNPAVERAADWRRLIAEIREVYDGKLTYAANWWKEYEEITFWDDLDYIGVQGYFPLSETPTPTVTELRAGWRRHVGSLKAISQKFDKPILFTEQGYKSTHDTADEPWQWPQRSDREKLDLQAQANCYEAFFQTFWAEPWVAGVYWWKWFPSSNIATTRNSDNAGYTPQGKPAQDVITEWFGQR